MGRVTWERLAGIAGLVFVALYVGAFSLGIEVGKSEREILEYYADSGHRTREVIAFFLIAIAALALVVFAVAMRSIVARVEQETAMLAALAQAGGVAAGALILAGDAVSRAPAFTAMEEDFNFQANVRTHLEDAGVLLFSTGIVAGALLVVAVSLAALRYGVLPRWLAWAGLVATPLLALGIVFLGFLVFFFWMIAVSVTLASRRAPSPASSRP